MNEKFLFIALLFTGVVYSQSKEQKQSINDFNFESITNPAFMLIDETPTAIETPDNLKSLSLYLYNGFSEGNVALEVNPYWAFKTFGYNQEDSYEEYRGIAKNTSGRYYIKPLKSITTNTSISLGYTEKKFDGFDSENEAIAIGGRTTIMELFNKERTEKISSIVSKVGSFYSNKILDAYNQYLGGIVPKIPTPNVKKCEDFVNKKAIPDEYKGAAKNFLALNPEYTKTYANEDELCEAYFDETSKKVLEFYYMSKNIKT